MEEANGSVVTLMDENKDLRFEIEQQLNIIESQKQEIHTYTRRIECLEKMKLEMEIEIEALTGLHQIKGNLECKVKGLENDLSATRLKCTNLEGELKEEKTNHQATIETLQCEIASLKENESVEKQDDGKQEELLTKLSLLQETNQLLTDANFELQTQNKSLSDKTVLLELSLNEKTRELEEIKEMVDVKTNDLKSALKLVEELQEEKTLLNAELTSLKCHPVSTNKRGNSLFAEVEDKRLSMVNRLEAMQNKYRELKKNFLKKNADLKALEAENIELRKQWKEDENDPYKNMASLVGSYKNRIQELCHTISILEKRPETPQIISIAEVTNAHVNCIKALVDEERKINQQLRNEMEQRSIRELTLNEQLFEIRQQMKNLKAQTMKDTAEKAELKLKLENVKNKENIASQVNTVIKKEVRMVD